MRTQALHHLALELHEELHFFVLKCDRVGLREKVLQSGSLISRDLYFGRVDVVFLLAAQASRRSEFLRLFLKASQNRGQALDDHNVVRLLRI